MADRNPAELDSETGLPIGVALGLSGPAPRPSDVVIAGRNVAIRRPDPEKDSDVLFESLHGAGSAALWLYMSVGPFADRIEFRQWIERITRGTDPYFYVLRDPKSDAALGLAALMRIDPANRVIEIGSILYSPRLQRTAAATEAIYLFARYVFELGYRRFEWKCNSLNAPSRRAAQRFGFSYEGLFRQHMVSKGFNRDTAWYSMLDSEWARCRAAFEAWLDPSNFDSAGRQIRPLAAIRESISEPGSRPGT